MAKPGMNVGAMRAITVNSAEPSRGGDTRQSVHTFREVAPWSSGAERCGAGTTQLGIVVARAIARAGVHLRLGGSERRRFRARRFREPPAVLCVNDLEVHLVNELDFVTDPSARSLNPAADSVGDPLRESPLLRAL